MTGAAQGVSIVGNVIGLKYDGTTAMGNQNDGIEVGGEAHDIVIGGPPGFSTLPQNTISGNGLNGVEITETAHNIGVNDSFIGTDVSGLHAVGNAQDGINVSAHNPSVTIGSLDPALDTVISGNTGNGIQIALSDGNRIMKTKIGTDVSGTLALGNGGDGIAIEHNSNTRIGSSNVKKPTANAPNIIAFNDGNGVNINLGDGNSILGNSIYGNASSGIELARLTNNRQTAPVLDSVQTIPQGIQVTGTLSMRRTQCLRLSFLPTARIPLRARFSWVPKR